MPDWRPTRVSVSLPIAAAWVVACGGDPAGPVTAPLPEPVALAFVAQPADAVAGSRITLRVAVRDRDGNRVPGAATTVTLALLGGPTGGRLVGTAVRSADSGEAVFDDLSVERAGDDYRLVATATHLHPDTTAPVAVTAANPASVTSPVGGALEGAASAMLPDPIRVTVTDRFGNAVAGAEIGWRVMAGSGSVDRTNTITDSGGAAEVRWTLGPAAGEGNNALRAAVLDVDSVTFTASARAGPAALLTAMAGDGQTATVGTAVALPPAVRVHDAAGNPVPGVVVTFRVVAGGGRVEGLSAATDAQGEAWVGRWTLGAEAGDANNVLEALVAGIGAVTFTATAVAGSGAGLSAVVGNGQTAAAGTAVSTPPAVRITDALGNAVPGVAVRFAVTAGGGMVTGAEPVSDDAGIAAAERWTLGTAAGADSDVLYAVVSGLDSVRFTASAIAGPAAAVAIAAGDGQEVPAGTELPVPPAVRVSDQFGNAVSGSSVTFRVIAGGGFVTGTPAVTAGDGVAAVDRWTLGPGAGTDNNRLRAVVPGVDSVTFTATGHVGTPASVTIVAGDGQSATVGTAVFASPAVRVRDAVGNPVPGAAVGFDVIAGDGAIGGSPALTDAMGIAMVGSWTLGTAAGTANNAVRAGVVGVDSVTFTASAAPAGPATLAIESGDTQTAPVGTVVALAPAVRVRDAYGNATPGVAVTFTTPTGGLLTGTPAITAADGVATLGSWTLGAAGVAANLLQAAVVGAGAVAFTASGTVTLTTIAAGVSGDGDAPHDCAVTQVGVAVCWGENADGQLGDGTRTDSEGPVLVMGALTFASVSAGGRHSCGITPAGAAYCWGRNADGQLGDGTVTSRISPVPVTGGLTFASASAGVAHTCGVTVGGALYCWGRNLTGQVGEGTSTSRNTPVAVNVAGAAVAMVSAGSAHTCAVTVAGAAYCWGRNLDGALGAGDGSPDQRTVPTVVAGGHSFATVAAGRAHTCGVTTSQAAYCWGQNDDGELGDGTNTPRFTPAAVSGGVAFVSVGAGGGSESALGSDDYSCGRTPGGAAWCWGSNVSGQLGTGGGADTNVPVPVDGGLLFDVVLSGSDHACGLSAAGVAYCWGADWDPAPLSVPGQP